MLELIKHLFRKYLIFYVDISHEFVWLAVTMMKSFCWHGPSNCGPEKRSGRAPRSDTCLKPNLQTGGGIGKNTGTTWLGEGREWLVPWNGDRQTKLKMSFLFQPFEDPFPCVPEWWVTLCKMLLWCAGEETELEVRSPKFFLWLCSLTLRKSLYTSEPCVLPL